MTGSDSAAEAHAWVEGNRPVADAAFQHFLEHDEWPIVSTLQRDFDRRGSEVDVQAATDRMPPVVFGVIGHRETVILSLRHLMWIERARPLVTICVNVIRRAAQAYLSHEDEPVVTSEDGLVTFPFDLEGHIRFRAAKVLMAESLGPFSGLSGGPTGWTLSVDPKWVRPFRDVTTIEDFIAQQDEVRSADSRPTYPAVTPPVPLLDSAVQVPGGAMSAVPSRVVVDKLFVSWGRDTGKRVAQVLVPILEARLPGAEIFFSPISIEPGEDPSHRMFHESLLHARALVVVLTQDGADSAYVVWESAAAWALGQLVIPIFVDIEPGSVAASEGNDSSRSVALATTAPGACP